MQVTRGWRQEVSRDLVDGLWWGGVKCPKVVVLLTETQKDGD